MELRQFRFKKEFYKLDGIENISGLVICNGFGYDFKTICCKKCGEIFVINNEYLFHKKITIEEIVKDENCPKCNVDLKNNIVNYPENIFHDGKMIKNTNAINRLHFENTELIEVYTLT
jgi:hypothetical protein